MDRKDLTTYIDYMSNTPAALENSRSRDKSITEGIIQVLTWSLRFIDFYNRTFKNKKGEYRKSGWAKAIGIAGAVFSLGLELVNIKKRKL